MNLNFNNFLFLVMLKNSVSWVPSIKNIFKILKKFPWKYKQYMKMSFDKDSGCKWL